MLSLDELLAECRIPGTVGLRPHPQQSLRGLRFLFRGCFWAPEGPFRVSYAESLIVLAVDGLSFEAARTAWSSPSLLAPWTSTFPSVSGTAWITAATGLTVENHRVPGVVFRLPESGALYNYYAGQEIAAEDPPPGSSSEPPGGAPFPTVFTDMLTFGIDPIALGGDMGPWPEALTQAVLYGARRRRSRVAWEKLRFKPKAMAEAMVAAVDAVLNRRRRGVPLFLWAYVNLDDAIHRTGYDEAVFDALAELETAARRWRGNGHTVVAHGDHGLVPYAPSAAAAEGFAAVAHDPTLCRLPPGGAGRVLWAYPHPGREEEVRARLAEGLGDTARVVLARDLADWGLLGWNDDLAARLGGVCALAIDAGFPAPFAEGKTFEHGSFTEAEMLTALAVWSR